MCRFNFCDKMYLVLQVHQIDLTFLSQRGLLQDLVCINQQLLEVLGVSHHTIRQLCSIAAKHGLSAKLTGAGGGGCVFAIAPLGQSYPTQLSMFRSLQYMLPFMLVIQTVLCYNHNDRIILHVLC